MIKEKRKMIGEVIMKKIKALLAILLMASLVLAGCGGNNKVEEKKITWEATVSGDGSLERVQKAGKLTIGLDDSYPPMGFRDPATNEIIGFDIDMAKLIGEKLGVEVELVPSDWNAIVPSLQTEKFDVIVSGMNMWDERIKEVNFVPYGEADQYIIVRADSEFAKGEYKLEDFKSKKIGTQLGSTAAKDLMGMGFAEGKNLTLYKTFPEITLDLDNGRIDALAIDSFGAGELIKSGNYKKLLTMEASKDGEKGQAASKIGIAVRKTDGDLQRAIQKAVDELIADGSLGELSNKWIGSDITAPLKVDGQEKSDKKA